MKNYKMKEKNYRNIDEDDSLGIQRMKKNKKWLPKELILLKIVPFIILVNKIT